MAGGEIKMNTDVNEKLTKDISNLKLKIQTELSSIERAIERKSQYEKSAYEYAWNNYQDGSWFMVSLSGQREFFPNPRTRGEEARAARDHVHNEKQPEIDTQTYNLQRLEGELVELTEQLDPKKQEMKYNELLYKKASSVSEEDFKTLMDGFGKMAKYDYKDTNLMADECRKQYNILKKRRIEREEAQILEDKYNDLCNKKDTASKYEERVFFDLVDEFRKIENYKNSAFLANECQNIANKIVWQRKSFIDAGRCQYCGGKLSYYTYEGPNYTYRQDPWHDPYYRRYSCKCKSCGKPTIRTESSRKQLWAIWMLVEVLTAILGAIFFKNFFVLIPFAIVFFTKYDDDANSNGFRQFVRISSVIANTIVCLVFLISSASFFGVTGFIFLSFACIRAYKIPLRRVDGYWQKGK